MWKINLFNTKKFITEKISTIFIFTFFVLWQINKNKKNIWHKKCCRQKLFWWNQISWQKSFVWTTWHLDNGWDVLQVAFCNLAMFSKRTLNGYGLDYFGGFFVQNLTFWNLFQGKIQPVWRCARPTSAPDHCIIWKQFGSDTRCHIKEHIS